MVLFKQVAVNARLGIKALRPGLAHHFNKVFIAGFVLAKQNEVISFVIKPVYLIKP